MPRPLVLLPLSSLAACDRGAPPEPAPSAEVAAPAALPAPAPVDLAKFVGAEVGLQVRDLVLLLDGAEVYVPYLDGRLLPRGDLVDLDDPTSFVVEVDALEVRIPEQSLQRALRGPVDDLSLRTDGDAFVLRGHAGALGLPFVLRARPAVSPSGDVTLALEKVRVLGVGIRGVLSAFRGPIEHAVNDEPPRHRLLDVERDLLIVHPFPFAGPPEVHAAFTSVEVSPEGLVARLGDPPAGDPPAPGGVRLVGGAMRSGASLLFGTTVSLAAAGADAGDDDPQDHDSQLIIDPAQLPARIAASCVTLGDRRVTLHLPAIEGR